MRNANTIFALATPPGKSGVAVVRLSGPQARPALKSLSGLSSPVPRHAHYVELRAPGGSVIDRGLAIYFPAPGSFTGEDVVELQAHGSLAVIRELLETLAGLEGLRPAEPGEFSRRAFLNGKMDLIEAEGLADLVAAETPAQKRQALGQLRGALSHHYDALRARMIESLAHLEATIDFPDEEIPASVLAGLEGELKVIRGIITQALQDNRRGERLREGINVVILGAPNAGKSSLLNALARRDAAIVSARAGTTRDLIEVHLDIGGFPVVLVDTAGLRDTADDIEEEGVRRALKRAEAADIRLVLFDGEAWPRKDSRTAALLDGRSIPIISKSDILLSSINTLKDNHIILSAQTGKGIDRLLSEIEKRMIAFFSAESAPMVTRHRHRALLAEADKHLERALMEAPLELRCEALRQAAQAVAKITGGIALDEVLDVVFSQFCIGK